MSFQLNIYLLLSILKDIFQKLHFSKYSGSGDNSNDKLVSNYITWAKNFTNTA